VERREFFRSSVMGLGGAAGFPPLSLASQRSGNSPAEAGTAGRETLSNGIQLPSPWPPRLTETPKDPITPAYLLSPPAVIPIDVGRQLFVDDFLIAETTLKRTFHLAEYFPDNPILKPDKPWEVGDGDPPPCAMVFSDGVWYDPQDHRFKMWYMGGYVRSTCYATSKDGIHWEKPALDVKEGTNIVVPGRRDSNTVWLDLGEKDPKRRFKMFRSTLGGKTTEGKTTWSLSIHFSPDGIHWSEPPLFSGPCGDRTTVFWNPFRKVWVFSLRQGGPRRRRYWETRDLVTGRGWTAAGEPPLWIGSDRLDPPRPDMKITPELYNLDCVAYESLILGLFTIWRGQPQNREKPNEVCVGFSRDGWSWSRPDRRAFCPVSERPGDWNYSNVQSAGGCCLIVGDKLYFYVSGRGGTGKTRRDGQMCVTSLALLRRDGFASMDAGEAHSTLTTRPVRFHGKYLFVNLDAVAGELRAEILDERGQEIAPFSLANCLPVRGDKTLLQVNWKGVEDLSALAGKTVTFRFHLRKGRLYAFWVSPQPSGASHGYVAAGGPGFTDPTDISGAAQL